MNFTSLIFIYLVSIFSIKTHGLSETKSLLNFKKSLVVGKQNALDNWDVKHPLCKWVGVLCAAGFVRGLQLENLNLSGSLDIEALKGLKSLRSLNVMNNKFGGLFPEFKRLSALRSLYLSNNEFEGDIKGDAFDGMNGLKIVYLAHNKFRGNIPTSLTKIPKLLELKLDGNEFIGKIPEFTQKLQMLNLSYNELTGFIPENLSTMDPKVFEGNKGLCGKPLDTSCYSPFNISQELKQRLKKFSSRLSFVIVATVAAIITLLIIGLIIVLHQRHKNKQPQVSTKYRSLSIIHARSISQNKIQSSRFPSYRWSGSLASKRVVEVGKLSFLREVKETFDLQDLLKASAEILGSGCFGGSYKTMLSSESIMVVKRYKHMNNAGNEKFHEHMKRLGKLNHQNLLPIVAYYYRREERIFVSNFVERGSLSVHLHGHHSPGQESLDWPKRLKIVKGVARGLLYLYENLSTLMAPHGHLKSSNVLLNEKYEPFLAEYGLIPITNEEKAQELMVAYKSPEYLKRSRITKKTDVWALGILILEILTGKIPEILLQVNKEREEEDLATSIEPVFKGEWIPGLFDHEMGNTSKCETEILKLLNIGLNCCKVDLEKRLDIREVVEKIEDVKELEGDDDDFYSTHTCEVEGTP